MARRRPYKVFAISADGSETPLAIQRLRVEMSPGRFVEIDLRSRGDFMIRLDSPAKGGSGADLGASRLVVYPNASNSLGIHVTSRNERDETAKKR